MEPTRITVQATVSAPIEKVWEFWSLPEHITQWNSASEDWHTPRAVNDLTPGGKFTIRMEAKDGSTGFDLEGTYGDIKRFEYIGYVMIDGRTVDIYFTVDGRNTKVTETFDAERTHPIEMQRNGWQAILNNFKKYAESHL